jgi:uncharacterized protein YggE
MSDVRRFDERAQDERAPADPPREQPMPGDVDMRTPEEPARDEPAPEEPARDEPARDEPARRASTRRASPSATGTIVVSGTGRVTVQPDTADLRLGVTVSKPSVGAARLEAGRTMEDILDALEDAGIDRDDVRTALLSVQPRYDYRDGRAPVLAGYDIANVVEVTVRDLAALGDVVDGTLGAGATSMDGLTFRLADPARAEREARTRAMAEARSRADVLAEAAGISIDGVSDIVEGAPARPPMPLAKGERMAMAADVSTPVEAGTLEVSVTVTVTYRTREEPRRVSRSR